MAQKGHPENPRQRVGQQNMILRWLHFSSVRTEVLLVDASARRILSLTLNERKRRLFAQMQPA
jgi:hypothetical protein